MPLRRKGLLRAKKIENVFEGSKNPTQDRKQISTRVQNTRDECDPDDKRTYSLLL